MNELREGAQFNCRMTPKYFLGYTIMQRQPLPVVVSEAEPVRLNVLMTGVGRDLTGGPLSIMRFMNALLAQTRLSVRWINVDGEGLHEGEFVSHMAKYPALELLRKKGQFVFGALGSNQKIPMNPNDLLMATLYWTSHICHATVQHPKLRNKNFLYFIQVVLSCGPGYFFYDY